MNKVIDDSLKLILVRMSHQNIEVEKNLAEDIPLIQASGGQLQQVFLNIINNAYDAMSEGGKLTISTEKNNKNLN